MSLEIQKFVLYEKNTGRVVSSGTSHNPEKLCTAECDVLLYSQGTPNESYVANGVVVQVPPCTTPGYVFDWVNKSWVGDPVLAWDLVRARRDRLLTQTDWFVTKAAEQREPIPADVSIYRQALRDITEQADPFTLVWPVLSN